jgi:WD40 repeat protein
VVSALADGTVKLWDVDSGELLHSLQADSDLVFNAEFNGDGTQVVSASDNGTVKLWDVMTGQLLHSFEAHSGPVISAKFNRDGTRVVSASFDGTVKIWKVETLDELLNRACDWLRPYLTSNPNVTEADQALCNIPPPETSPSD